MVPDFTLPLPRSIAGWTLLVSVFGNLFQFVLDQRRRREGVSIKTRFGHRISLERDGRHFPTTTDRHNPVEGERCWMVTVRYHGRHSVRLLSAKFEIACTPELFRVDPPMEPFTLLDGQSKKFLLLGRNFDIRDVTGFAITTESHGPQFKKVRRILRRQLGIEVTRPRLYLLVRALTGVPHPMVSSDMNPKRCPRCWSGRRHFQFVDEGLSEPVPGLWLNRRRFTCGKCRRSWFAHETASPPALTPEPASRLEGGG